MRSAIIITIWFIVGVVLAPTLPAQELVAAGQEGALQIPGSSAPGVIAIPSDWVRGKRLPLIFFMHGSGGSPTSWPWKSATGNKGYIIVGLPYGAQEDAGAQGIRNDPNTTEKMVALIEQVRKQVDEAYGIDQDQVILSGLSMGGWGVNFYGFVEAARDRYAGYAIIAAGPRQDGQCKLEVAAGYPVLLLNGENDQNLATANANRPLLEKVGALVEQVVLEKQPHVPSIESMVKPLAAWLGTVARFAEGRRGLGAVSWRDLRLDGAAPRKKEELADFLASSGWLEGRGEKRPVFIYGQSLATENDKPTKAATISAKADADLFRFPAACEVPAVLREFECLRLDLGRIEADRAGFFAEKSAPILLVFDAEGALVASFTGTAPREASLQAKLLEALDDDARARVAITIEKLKSRIAELVKIEKDLVKERKSLDKLLAGRKPNPKTLAERRQRIAELEQRHEVIASELRAARP
ncbi:MAG: hypothetical protein H6807_00705 [Planctomycetes bacterium]|nr:hypothetical protein [Planctomycetota bacterium]